jgi:hypothetical protein
MANNSIDHYLRMIRETQAYANQALDMAMAITPSKFQPLAQEVAAHMREFDDKLSELQAISKLISDKSGQLATGIEGEFK